MRHKASRRMKKVVFKLNYLQLLDLRSNLFSYAIGLDGLFSNDTNQFDNSQF